MKNICEKPQGRPCPLELDEAESCAQCGWSRECERGEKMDFAAQLIDFRRQANMTIGRLSELSGVPTSTISNYEHGVMPTLDKADKLMKALGMSLVIGKGAQHDG